MSSPELARPDPSDRPDPAPAKLWTLILGVALAVVLAVGVGLVVFILVLEHLQLPRADAARTAITLVGIPTAAGAVFVALRSLHLKERQLHTDQQRVADAYRTYALAFDAEHTRRQSDQERELRARYVSAAEQMGHDSAAVRLAGVNAMAQLATDWSDQRQSCVDVLCAYLRLPQLTTSSGDLDPSDGEVRRTTQRLISQGFTKAGDKDSQPAWPATDLDLDGAVLDQFQLVDGVARKATFKKTHFMGYTSIDAGISNATFDDSIFFGAARLAGMMGQSNFRRVTFHENASLTIFSIYSPNFFRMIFKGRLTLSRAVLSTNPYTFHEASFAFQPPVNDLVSYIGCTLNGTPLKDSVIRD
ncbi:hypothetical protein CQ020_03630 [Arthrobacter sp. MYb23]|nr:hypothetical protein CQ020_03630 [Arthrobacter sp. MYb23]